MRAGAKLAARSAVRSNIERHGYHIYLILAETVPRFAYTVGLSQAAGRELIFAGGAYFSAEEVQKIIQYFAGRCDVALTDVGSSKQTPFGSFSFREVDDSWINLLLLGALDFYEETAIRAVQIVPNPNQWTIDTPNLSKPWTSKSNLPWRWLYEKWNYLIPDNTLAITNLEALRGKPVTEAARWESDQWELFAGSVDDDPRENFRVVPIGILLAADESLVEITRLKIGHAAWRDSGTGIWQPWGRSDPERAE